MFEETILNNNAEQIAKLWVPAGKAHEDPSIGIKEFSKKAAFYVIRDCAKIAKEYIPLHVWGLYDDPLVSLRGKFTKVDVDDFINRSKTDVHAGLLKKVIITDIKNRYDVVKTPSDSTPAVTIDDDDVYGYYEGYGDDEEETPVISTAESLSDNELISKYLL